MSSISITTTTIHDLPDVILTNIIALVSDVRSRNNISLTSRKWFSVERSTRSSLSLKGNIGSHVVLRLPTSFSSLSHLDLSLLSPWGIPFLLHHHHEHQQLVALRLRQAFPNLTSLTVYARNPSTLQVLAPLWPGLRHVSLVRWHQRPHGDPPGADFEPLFAACTSLESLDLAQFYCWTEDVPAALNAYPISAAALVRINLISAALTDGFRSSEIVSISAACPNLKCFLAPCVFNPMHFDFVGDDALLALAANCAKLTQLHLVDPSSADVVVQFGEVDSRISCSVLQRVFTHLSQLEDLALDLCHWVKDAGPALEVLGNKCGKMKILKLGRFQGICRAAGLHLDGVSVCGGLQSLSLKNPSDDLTDCSLKMIARGCSRLSKLEFHGCGSITEGGVRMMVVMLRSTLVDVKISACPHLDTAASLRALSPVRDRIQRLHIDCVWVAQDNQKEDLTQDLERLSTDDDYCDFEEKGQRPNKRCKYSENNGSLDLEEGIWYRSWDRLQYLSLWLPAGEVLSPLPDAGLDNCPELEEICIKIEGDCRTCPRPTQTEFGLSCLDRYLNLKKMKLDCGDAIGYAFTAPTGQMDLSLWERFYLHGIGSLIFLEELDYWPPQDREVNQRSLSLPAAGLIQGCENLRKLFIHGTAHEHFMGFFLLMQKLRDVQLREDYYPAPENDMCTEMRVHSCIRFEDALNSRQRQMQIPE